MIRSSMARFIRSSELNTSLGLTSYVFTPDFVVGEHQKPISTVTYLAQGQDLYVIGDAQRKENPILQVTFYLKDLDQRKAVRHRFLRLIESAKATDDLGNLKPGINYMPENDILRDSGDHKTYYSDQPAWFASPVPIVYKNDAIITTGFSIDYVLGNVVFTSANLSTDVIKATYKCGIIDFNVRDIQETQLVDQANNLHRFNVVVDLEAHYYIKTNVNKYI